jgi:acrylyl-CoA reductase (NADPH)
MAETYRALVVDKAGEDTEVKLVERSAGDLPDGEVTVRVAYSSVNYKDGLATLAKGGVVRSWPRVPGIDLAGTVIESRDARFAEGDEVLVTGYDLGVGHDGGFAELARVPADWVVKRPDGLSLRECMAFGTAGFTAALAVSRLAHHGITPAAGPAIVTGATGGVGSIAVSMLSASGFEVTATTGKAGEHDYLKSLGASRILAREEISAETRPLDAATWAAAVDQVGGTTLPWLMARMKYRGAIACTGLTGGPAFKATVLPFLLRAVSILGIDSVFCPMAERLMLWQRMAGELKPAHLNDMIAAETDLDGLKDTLATILKGGVRGRTVVRIG